MTDSAKVFGTRGYTENKKAGRMTGLVNIGSGDRNRTYDLQVMSLSGIRSKVLKNSCLLVAYFNFMVYN